ncbi:Na(+)/H(+) antiporter subunit F [Oceanobacillus oncorhynchi subsp. incaldanensis]|uniref:Na(+)/H(+) antiporter subunit F n=2 Tax=Oceanobacillus TaxID=182709 RepID=A0A0A1MXW6_9BACI|nr:Na(+)/H(+) antiporter subunit F1 [Oceanobacillus oncorhynchi]MDM8099336.1 Na(+)/H(+) antiporter subunit F1 [Oceanobacillus oncorhynchi]UUI38534.1 Na(+)/H(+) antiporter subunit F1 [Oceanobacillus oncorhynchi]GIO19722.1 Na(+)/H(+) antiporter subunit F [Oceanobacillus oncorhynchi subsp. incaldanensis]CEI84222.1 Na(+)/H(+) antiporter subunit F [Oceanobacillus oncorhynchi]
MFDTILIVALSALSVALVLLFIRVMIGPSTQDRILALDAIGVLLVGFIGILMILQDTSVFSDIVLVLTILGFVGTLTLSKFLERGVVIDRDD